MAHTHFFICLNTIMSQFLMKSILTSHIIKSLTICIKNNHTDDNKQVEKINLRNKSIDITALSDII